MPAGLLRSIAKKMLTGAPFWSSKIQNAIAGEFVGSEISDKNSRVHLLQEPDLLNRAQDPTMAEVPGASTGLKRGLRGHPEGRAARRWRDRATVHLHAPFAPGDHGHASVGCECGHCEG